MIENKIEVGDYIRTKEFGIAKIIYQISEIGFGGRILEREYKIDRKEKGYGATYKEVSSKDIVKHSKDIIDLIEIGDIVTIILNESTNETTKFCFESQKQIDIFKESECLPIKSIVTKEQFESIEYKVGE